VAKVASRPRNDLWRVRAARNLALIGAFLLPLLLTAGCNTGSRNEAGPPGPQLDPAQPLVTGINPEGGAPGDLITVSGKNFSPNLDENHVYFTNNNGSISIPGRIESVNVGVFVEGEGADSSLTVRVPTGVRTGFLNVEIDNVLNPNTGLTQDGVPAGARGFTGAPVVLGYAINDSGLGFAILQPFGALQPNTVTLLGYNLINNRDHERHPLLRRVHASDRHGGGHRRAPERAHRQQLLQLPGTGADRRLQQPRALRLCGSVPDSTRKAGLLRGD
jgi:hypothetical protein